MDYVCVIRSLWQLVAQPYVKTYILRISFIHTQKKKKIVVALMLMKENPTLFTEIT